MLENILGYEWITQRHLEVTLEGPKMLNAKINDLSIPSLRGLLWNISDINYYSVYRKCLKILFLLLTAHVTGGLYLNVAKTLNFLPLLMEFIHRNPICSE